MLRGPVHGVGRRWQGSCAPSSPDQRWQLRGSQHWELATSGPEGQQHPREWPTKRSASGNAVFQKCLAQRSMAARDPYSREPCSFRPTELEISGMALHKVQQEWRLRQKSMNSCCSDLSKAVQGQSQKYPSTILHVLSQNGRRIRLLLLENILLHAIIHHHMLIAACRYSYGAAGKYHYA